MCLNWYATMGISTSITTEGITIRITNAVLPAAFALGLLSDTVYPISASSFVTSVCLSIVVFNGVNISFLNGISTIRFFIGNIPGGIRVVLVVLVIKMLGMVGSTEDDFKIEYDAKIGPFADEYKIGPIEDDSKIGPVEDDSKIGPVEDDSKIGPVEDEFKKGPIEDDSRIVQVEDDSKIGTIEDGSKIGPIEYGTKVSPIEYGTKVG
ncbi:unnamed protein product, partial [Owenia fusiformis]